MVGEKIPFGGFKVDRSFQGIRQARKGIFQGQELSNGSYNARIRKISEVLTIRIFATL